MLTSTPEITKFVYSVLVTDKLERIVKGLEENKYKDSSIEFLNTQLEKFANLLLDVKNIELRAPKLSSDRVMNAYTRDQYLRYFKAFHKYFSELEIEV